MGDPTPNGENVFSPVPSLVGKHAHPYIFIIKHRSSIREKLYTISGIQMMECLIAAKCVQGSEDLPVTKTLLSLSMRAVRTAHQGTRQLAQGTRE